MSIMQNLLRKGAVVKTDIHIWSGRKSLKAIEIGRDEVNKDLISLGSKWLIPKKEIDELFRIRSKATALIESYSMRFDFGSFVPESKIEPLKEKLEKLRDEFHEKVSSIMERLPELKQKMLDEWYKEAINVTGNDPDAVFQVMNSIKESFDRINESYLKEKFRFGYREYHDINKIAEEFIKESTVDIVYKFQEFAEKLRDRIEMGKLQDRNLKAVRKFIEEMRDAVEVFENEELTKIFDTMDQWSMEGVASDVATIDKIKSSMLKAMDSVIEMGEQKINKIASRSVTTFRRKIL